jgi:hypothetical protein
MEAASRARPYLDVSSTAAAAAAAYGRSARRQQLVNWMMLLQLRLGLQAETLHLGVSHVDVFLAHPGHAAKFLTGNAAAVASGSHAGASPTIGVSAATKRIAHCHRAHHCRLRRPPLPFPPPPLAPVVARYGPPLPFPSRPPPWALRQGEPFVRRRVRR